MKPNLRFAPRAIAIIGAVLALASSMRADIFRWEYVDPADPTQGIRQSATAAPGGRDVIAAPGADLSQRDLTMAYFVGADLRGAALWHSTLTDADFTDALVQEAMFERQVDHFGVPVAGTGITFAQLAATRSYRQGDLHGISFGYCNFSEADFRGMNLMNTRLASISFVYDFFGWPRLVIRHANLAGADLTGADLRGAFFLNLDGAITRNLIHPDGHIHGLDLGPGEILEVREYDNQPFPIVVDERLTMDDEARLRIVLDDQRNSIISFAPEVPVRLDGVLELNFAPGVIVRNHIGRTFDLFDWEGVVHAGAFTISSPYRWDLASLYATGEVTLAAVPEPRSIVLLMAATILLILVSRRARSSIAVAVLIANAPRAAADPPMTGAYVPELQAVDSLLQSFMASRPIPGATIAITHDDKVIYERGIGYSNEARTAPMQESALMRLASVSKPITASAIQQLVKDGLVSLDDKVFNIAGNGGILNITPYNGALGDSRLRDITLQHLLEHKGGWNREIAGDFAFEDVQIATTMGVPSPPGIDNSARYILSRPLQFTPGSAESYSNIGYMFLGMVVEAASGQAYEDYVDNHVLAPAGIPVWEVDAGRTFAADQNPREPVYSDPAAFPNVFDPEGPLVPVPYGGWDQEKALAFGGLIASSKAIALLAQSRIASGPEIGKLRSESTTNPENIGGHLGVLPGTLTLMVQESEEDWTYSILFDGLPASWSSDSISLFNSLNQILEGLTNWPEALIYAGDFTSDQWLTLDDVTLFKQALALGDEAAFAQAHPTARYSAGDFDGNGFVNGADAAGLIGALQHAGVPPEFVAQVLDLPGDFNLDRDVDGADFLIWQRHPNIGRLADWQNNFGTSPAANAAQHSVPEPATAALTGIVLAACRRRKRGGAATRTAIRKRLARQRRSGYAADG